MDTYTHLDDWTAVQADAEGTHDGDADPGRQLRLSGKDNLHSRLEANLPHTLVLNRMLQQLLIEGEKQKARVAVRGSSLGSGNAAE